MQHRSWAWIPCRTCTCVRQAPRPTRLPRLIPGFTSAHGARPRHETLHCPSVKRSCDGACATSQNPSPNAYTLAIAGRKPFIVVHSALLELLKPAEVQAVLAHELGHLKCDHGVWLTAANVIASGTVSVRVPLCTMPLATALRSVSQATVHSHGVASWLFFRECLLVN